MNDERLIANDGELDFIFSDQLCLLTKWFETLRTSEYSSKANMMFFEKLMYSIINKKNIYFTGVGKNVPMLTKVAATMKSLSMNAFVFNVADAIHGDMGCFKENDILIVVSKSGNTSELLKPLEMIRMYKPLVKVFLITMNNNAKVNDFVNYKIVIPSIDELDAMNLLPTMSPIAFQLFFDAIIVKIAQELQFTTQQFFENHSGGQIGDTLRAHKLSNQ